jgi:uncharacterized membrane protein YozB (DUF420 family)
MPIDPQQLPAVNAALNGLATLLLIAGYVLIKLRNERAHKAVMLSAFATSVLFLVCYLVYHYQIGGGKRYAGPDGLKLPYYAMLISHVILAAAVPVLAVGTIYFGLTDQRLRHRRWARWTLPIWLYVSITGVLIYLVLYVWFPGDAVMGKIM